MTAPTAAAADGTAARADPAPTGDRDEARLRGGPSFVILGAQRGGTTSLYRYLGAHPAVRPAARKELHYLTKHFDRGPDWYRAQFPPTPPGTIAGESTPYYLFHPLAPCRLHAVAPHAKLIVLLRNPVDRAHSHHQLETRRGHETLPFEEAIASEDERLAGEADRLLADDRYVGYNHQHYSYLARGRYVDQLRAWLAVFPRDRVLILRSEDLYRDPAAVVDRATAFLGLPSVALADPRPHNDGRYAALRPETRRRLAAGFAPKNEELAALLGTDVGWDSG